MTNITNDITTWSSRCSGNVNGILISNKDYYGGLMMKTTWYDSEGTILDSGYDYGLVSTSISSDNKYTFNLHYSGSTPTKPTKVEVDIWDDSTDEYIDEITLNL